MLRLVSVNLWCKATSLESTIQEFIELQADVIALQEVTPGNLRKLEESGLLGKYRHRVARIDDGHSGIGVWSLFELRDEEWLDVAGEAQLRVWAHLPNGVSVHLYVVHAPAPLPSKIRRWHRWFTSMGEDMSREVAAHHQPIVIAGDFNATMDHRPFRNLLRSGFVDAAHSWARDLVMTWPSRWRVIPPLFRIDHILVRAGVDIGAYRVGRGRGSDHRLVMAELDLRVEQSASGFR